LIVLRIAQVAPLAESVPPKLYGGTERVVSWLTEELVALGHDVTLFAGGDSVTSASLIPVWPQALRLSRPRPDPCAACAVLLEKLAEQVSSFDVIHSHIDWLPLPLLRRLGVPSVTTLHGRLDLEYVATTVRSFSDASFVSISDHQRTPLPGLNWLGTVYHGMPLDSLMPCYEPDGYLAFLGRITPEKGPEDAIRWARAAHRPLRIAAKIPRSKSRYFKERIEPLLNGNGVEFLGEVADSSKQSFLSRAAALLFPIDWPEPFGLVMIEAMACGTPVIATRRGSVPEIIEHGVTGFVVDSEQEALAALDRVSILDRRRVRAEFERRFSAKRMAKDYLKVYHALAQERTSLFNDVPTLREGEQHGQSGLSLEHSALRPLRTPNRAPIVGVSENPTPGSQSALE
jgi:glycosyltransferase involved in cell wall biosynthesis